MSRISEFIWTLHSSIKSFLAIFSYATDRSKINSDQKRLIFNVSLYPLQGRIRGRGGKKKERKRDRGGKWEEMRRGEGGKKREGEGVGRKEKGRG